MKWLKTDKPKKGQFNFTNNGTVIINIGERTTETTVETLKLATDSKVRAAIEGMVAPLRRDGVDTLDVYETEHPSIVETITKSDIDYFVADTLDGETLLDNTRDAVLSIVRLSFIQDHKWGFTDGTTKISAKIQDMKFWQDIQERKASFSKGDHVLVSVRTRTFRRDDGELKSEYFIEKVFRLIHRPQQGELLELPAIPPGDPQSPTEKR